LIKIIKNIKNSFSEKLVSFFLLIMCVKARFDVCNNHRPEKDTYLAEVVLHVAVLVEVSGQVHKSNFRQAKVGELDMTQRGDEQVVGLEVAVDDAVTMQVLDGERGLGEVDARHVQRQRAHVLEQRGHVPALHVLHAHAQVAPRLEGAHQRHHERVVGEGHDVALDKHLLQLVAQHQVLLLDLLHGEALLGGPVAHEVDGPVGAVADQLDLLEVLFARLLGGVGGDGERRAPGVLVVVGEELVEGVAVQA